MRDTITYGVIPFGLGLAGAVAYRLSAEAMAVVAGVISAIFACTVMAGVVLVFLRAADRQAQAPRPRRPSYGQMPPIVIVQPGAPTQLTQGQPGGWPAPYPWPAQRSFSGAGDEDAGQTDGSFQFPW